MYGHADSTLTPCALCPGWAPRWAKTINDDGQPVCKEHAIATTADLKEMK